MFCFSSHFPAVVMTADSLSRCQFWKWLFVSSCSQMADESLWRVKFFFPSKMSVNKTGAELQWHLMCYSQETLKCGSRNNTWNLQLLPSVTFICCYERFPSKCILEYNKKKKTHFSCWTRSTRHCVLRIYVLSKSCFCGSACGHELQTKAESTQFRSSYTV